MLGEFERYAVYWVPKRDDALARFGASWMGWCAERGVRRPRTMLAGISIDIPTVTRQLWLHGFHAVLKAPFCPRDGRGRFSVEHVLGRLSEDSSAFELPRLQLAVVQRRVVLVSTQSCPALDDLITRIGGAMAALDPAATDNGASSTTGRVVQFPAVSAHRFLLPLTDPLDPEAAREVLEALQPIVEPMLAQPRRLHDVALMGDPGGGRPLRVLELYELLDQPRRNMSGALPVPGPDVLV